MPMSRRVAAGVPGWQAAPGRAFEEPVPCRSLQYANLLIDSPAAKPLASG